MHVDYTHAALKMIQTSLLPEVESSKPFRFVYTSGGLVPYLDSNILFFLGNARKARVRLPTLERSRICFTNMVTRAKWIATFLQSKSS